MDDEYKPGCSVLARQRPGRPLASTRPRARLPEMVNSTQVKPRSLSPLLAFWYTAALPYTQARRMNGAVAARRRAASSLAGATDARIAPHRRARTAIPG